MRTKSFHVFFIAVTLAACASTSASTSSSINTPRETAASAATVRDTPVVRVVQECAPSVVNVRTESVLDLREMPEWGQYGVQLDKVFQEYFGKAYSKGLLKYNSIGSGVVVSDKGWIVTNAHVVDKAKTIYVALKDGTILQGKVLKVSRPDDLAIIQVDPHQPLKPVKIADSDSIMTGETAIAIGDSMGLENSVTVGVISGMNRSFSAEECDYNCSGLLQTDASINPGNSGGALLNLNGELMGINLAVVQNAQNIGFAIPANKVRGLLSQLQP